MLHFEVIALFMHTRCRIKLIGRLPYFSLVSQIFLEEERIIIITKLQISTIKVPNIKPLILLLIARQKIISHTTDLFRLVEGVRAKS